ncbi:hypothetical protein SD81_035895 [Tolypothrix campylonemoides VB511288]|nr:hypothetical protein SD81_035895 [Tolypothrix campylonemoides VB511288]
MNPTLPQDPPLQPGDGVNVENHGNVAQRVQLVTEAGTVFSSVLPPGAGVSIVIGHEALALQIDTPDPDYDGLHLVGDDAPDDAGRVG